MLLGQDAGDLSPGRRALLDEDLAEAFLRRLPLLLDRALELLGGDRAVTDEERAKGRPRIAGGFHTPLIGSASP